VWPPRPNFREATKGAPRISFWGFFLHHALKASIAVYDRHGKWSGCDRRCRCVAPSGAIVTLLDLPSSDLQIVIGELPSRVLRPFNSFEFLSTRVLVM
jgi:hypothetical protein